MALMMYSDGEQAEIASIGRPFNKKDLKKFFNEGINQRRLDDGRTAIYGDGGDGFINPGGKKLMDNQGRRLTIYGNIIVLEVGEMGEWL